MSSCNNRKRSIPNQSTRHRGVSALLWRAVLSLAIALFLPSCRTNPAGGAGVPAGSPTTSVASSSTNQSPDARALVLKTERVRTACVNGRRRICGLVLQVDADGLVVDSGYTDLLRPELARSWVVHANVAANRTPTIVEGTTPGSVCVGLVFVTAIPKRPTVKPYDYVILQGYPAGEYIYTPVPNVTKTLRKFSAELEIAIEANLEAADK